VIEVLKGNVRQGKSLGWTLPFDLALLAIGAYGIYISTDWLVNWISQVHTGFISAKHLGWLSGWVMVLPNGILAFYYGCADSRKLSMPRKSAMRTFPFRCVSAFTRCSTRWVVPPFFQMG